MRTFAFGVSWRKTLPFAVVRRIFDPLRALCRPSTGPFALSQACFPMHLRLPLDTVRGRLGDQGDSMDISPLSPRIGAVIGGLDLAKPLDETTYAELRQALLYWKVIF